MALENSYDAPVLVLTSPQVLRFSLSLRHMALNSCYKSQEHDLAMQLGATHAVQVTKNNKYN